MPITTDVQTIGPASVIAIAGKIGVGETWHSLDEVLEEMRNGGVRQIVLNLSGVSFLDSAGLGILVMNLSKMKAAGGRLLLAEPQSRVQAAIQVTRLTGLFPIFASVEDALNSFEAPSLAPTVH
jgi:anti-sigma B factor antagonist